MEDPPALAGSAEIEVLFGVLRSALERDPKRRVARADDLASQLRQALSAPRGAAAHAQIRRFVALPLRILRADPDTDFLAFSVPDAVSAALSNVASIIVRSPQAVPQGTDVRDLGASLGVDVVFTGSLLRAGSAVRVTGQLTDAAAGTLIWTDTVQAPISDLFHLQDTLTERIVSSLALPLSAGDRRALGHQAPSSAEAYELYLRANQLMTESSEWDVARGLYERAVDLDPTYAPLWARLGRARRLIAKWGGPKGIGLMPQAEQAFRRALDLDPDLSIAHDLSAYAEAELGRAPEAMARLLRRLASRPTDVGLLAGLVTTCRYAGLYEASVAAHHRARQIDPDCATSVCWTHLLLGNLDDAVSSDIGTPPFCDLMVRQIRAKLTMAEVRQHQERTTGAIWLGIEAHRHLLEANLQGVLDVLRDLRAFGFADPEGWFSYALVLAHRGAVGPALDFLSESIDAGYACHAALVGQPYWSMCTSDPRWPDLVSRANAKVAHARALFDSAGGHGLLGLAATVPSTTAARPAEVR
jgi:TolB-like protein